MSTSIRRAAAARGTARSRFRPSRAGIINLWDYRDEEFVFADGWLALRGPNGSGKTKALEVLFPFVLDGRIEPRRLNPFASEERTMKSNLLYRGQDSAFSYVWLEFARAPEHGAAGEYVSVGVGLRAQRHNDRVTRWYFVADGRVGVDFSLLDAEDRPLLRKQLAAQIGPANVRDNAEEHRAAVDARLFGLGRERYEQLLNLVLTLRRPQLAKNLDPARLSNTLTEGLRPVDDDLLAEAARSFDDMEAVQRTLDGLVAADEATKTFLAIYTTYLRTHARSAADAVSRRRDETAKRRAAVGDANGAVAAAEEAKRGALAAQAAAENEPGLLRAHLDRLKTSTAYQSVEQLADLERLVRELAEAAARAVRELDARRAQVEKRDSELAAARSRVADHEAEASRLARTLAEEAQAAGVAWVAADTEPDGFATRVAARVAGRRDDLVAVRAAADRRAHAERDRVRAAESLSQAVAAAQAAEVDERAAATDVEQTRAGVRDRLVGWVSRHAPTLSALGCAEVAHDLTAAVAQAGEEDADDPRVVLARATTQPVQRLRDKRASVRSETSAVRAEHASVSAERAAIASEHDDAPTAWWARPAPRAGRQGAPLWRLVTFADGVSDADAAAIEAALEAANLLDAWVHPDDAATEAALARGEADAFLVAAAEGARPKDRTLAEVLIAEKQEYVDIGRVQALLASVALVDEADAAAFGAAGSTPVVVSTVGQFAQGIQVGTYAKAAAEFIGATARARRRAARLAECDRRLAELNETLDHLAGREAAISSTLDAAVAAERDLPGVGTIVAALRVHDRAAAVLRAKRETADAAAVTHDAAVAEVGAAELALRRVCAERALAAEAVEETSAALRRFELAGDRLTATWRAIDAARRTATEAHDRLDEAEAQLAESTESAHEASARHATEAEQLQTLRGAVGAEADAVLADIATTEEAIDEAERTLARARSDVIAAEAALAASNASRTAALAALRLAASEEQQEASGLAPFAHADLLQLLRCPPDLDWPAQRADWPDVDAVTGAEETGRDALPAEVIALLDALRSATRDLTPSESSMKQSTTRLTKAFDDLQAQLSAAGQDFHPEWTSDAGIIVVSVADEQGRAAVKLFADRVARDRHEQEALLTEAERRILEDTLLGTLARQIHQRTIDARDLVEAMDVDMRARRMSSGVSIGVGWQLSDDLDEEQRAVCRVLERDPARLGPDDLARMRRHFAGRIKAARSVRGDQTYRELLATVLDYRRWRVFAFRLHRPGGQPEPLTRARHSQLSGGEQSVSLHLPLFAAAHALFTSARPTCPRLLALDEAFAGVDDTGRWELMGLARQFDLDLFMTGFDLWATHANVAACAHYDLSHSPIEHTVSALLLVWDGAESIADLDGTLTAALGSPNTRTRPDARVAADGDNLFAHVVAGSFAADGDGDGPDEE